MTGGRADYGLLQPIMEKIRSSQRLELLVIATGTHLSPEFGQTERTIVEDGFPIDWRVDMLLNSDSSLGVTNSMGLGIIGFGYALDSLSPDLVLILGDRFEAWCAAAAATVARIPIAHVHGGETTEGAIDEAIRHGITKMAHLHFVAAEPYARRVVQLGEDPSRVHLVGAPGLDVIDRTHLLSRPELEVRLGLTLGERSLLVAFHPETLARETAWSQTQALLSALDELQDTTIILTLSNADPGGKAVNSLMRDYVRVNPRATVHASLGQELFLSCLAHVDGIIGNSSSGIIEAPALRTPTLNIGDRQLGRLRASSVIDCGPHKSDIRHGLERLFSLEFREGLASVVNPYGTPGASRAIVKILEATDAAGLLRKHFHNLPPD